MIDRSARIYVEHIKTTLLARFAAPVAERQPVIADSTDDADAEVVAFVENAMTQDATNGLKIVRNVSGKDLFGKSFPFTGRIAVGVVGPSGIALVDGVDLRYLTPKGAIGKTDRVARTFWQYGRVDHAATMSFRELQRIGIVFRGETYSPTSRHSRKHSRTMTAYSDAHDYAMHQFRKEADRAVESTSTADLSEFRDLLSEMV